MSDREELEFEAEHERQVEALERSMSIQRWTVARSELCPVGEESVEVVLYADHVAAMDEQAKGRDRIWDRGYDCGVSDERARIRAAVEAMPRTGGWTTPDGVIHEVDVDAVLAIIDGEAT